MLAAVAVLVAISFALAGSASALPKLYECQHPTTTGEEAFDLHHISPAVACQAVRTLAAWLGRDDNARHLYRCKRPAPDSAGFPVLKLHEFDGYHLRIVKGLEFYRGKSSFEVTGTDFPLNCT